MVTCYDVYDFLGAHCRDESECSLAQTWPDDVSVPTQVSPLTAAIYVLRASRRCFLN